jgi:hypothetical protein
MPPIWTKAWVRPARFSTLPGVVPVGTALEELTLAELEADECLEDDALVEEGVGVGVEVVVGL